MRLVPLKFRIPVDVQAVPPTSGALSCLTPPSRLLTYSGLACRGTSRITYIQCTVGLGAEGSNCRRSKLRNMRHCLTLQPSTLSKKAMTTLQPYLRRSCRPAPWRPPSLSRDGKQSTCYRYMPKQTAIVGEGGSHAWQSNEREEGRHSRNRELGPFHFVEIEGLLRPLTDAPASAVQRS